MLCTYNINGNKTVDEVAFIFNKFSDYIEYNMYTVLARIYSAGIIR